MPHNLSSASPHHASTKLYNTSVQLSKNKGLGGREEQRKAPFDISGVTNCPSKSLASIILNPQHAIGSQTLFAKQESGDESNTTFSKDGNILEGSNVCIDEDDSLNGGERSRVKETTESWNNHPREKMPHQGIWTRGKLRTIGMEPFCTTVITLKEELTRHLWRDHPRENRPHQGIQTRA